MTNDNVNTLLLSDIAIISSLIIIAIILAFIYFTGKRKFIREAQKKVLVQNPGLISQMAFPARYKRSLSFITGLIGMSGSGILTVAPEGVQYMGYRGQTTPVNLSVNADILQVTWLGKVLPLSCKYWLVVRNESENYYFTAETGKIFAGNLEETKEIYDYICSQVCK